MGAVGAGWAGHAGSGFGKMVRQRRREAGLSQEELAAQSGLSVRAISDIERGRTGCPRRSSVDLLASTLGVPAQDLLRPAVTGLPSTGRRQTAARLAAKVISDAEQEFGPGGGRVLLAALATALAGRLHPPLASRLHPPPAGRSGHASPAA